MYRYQCYVTRYIPYIIKNNFKKYGAESFVKFCVDATIKYVDLYNKNVESAIKEQMDIVREPGDSFRVFISDIDPKDVDVDDLTLEEKNISNIKYKVPILYGMLKKSYESRSTAKRFFSYFHFINLTAKEERTAMNTIRKAMEHVCHFSITEDDLYSLSMAAERKENLQYYQTEIKKINIVEEPLKESIFIVDEEAIDDNNLIEEIEEKDIEKNLIV